jgi:hypothetical protein
VLLAATFAAGCGATETSSDIRDAAVATEARGTARVEIVSSWSGAGERAESRETGVVDYGQRSSDLRGREGRTIRIGEITYSEIPGEDSRWLRWDDAETEELVAQSGEVKGEDGCTSYTGFVWAGVPEPTPDEFLTYLRGVAPDPVHVGEERVRGEPTTRFRTELDVRAATRRDLEASGWADENIEKALDGLATEVAAIDVWIDDEGLVRRVVWRTSDTFEGGRHDSVTTTEFYDFGVPVAIEPPRTGVIDWEEWLRVTVTESRERMRDESRREGITILDDCAEE